MKILESVPRMDLPDPRVWVCGDWHGNVRWVQRLLPALKRLDSQVSTILHVGDWWMDPEPVDYWCRRAGIERILVTLGNHEPYDEYTPLLDAHPGHAVRISDVVWLLPRPWRFSILSRELLSLGGATSLDRQWRTEGKDWWPDEVILDKHVAAAGEAPADVMITHETPASTPVMAVQDALRSSAHNFPPIALAASANSRARVDEVWNAVNPRLLFHGHMHVKGDGTTRDDRRVISLNRDTLDGNVALLDVATLDVDLPGLQRLRGR